MDSTEFLNAVAERSRLPLPEAATVTRATLTTLTARVSGGQARDLAAQLPEEFRGCLRKEVDFAEPLDLVQFLEEVKDRSGLDDERAAAGARAVLTTVCEAVSADERDDLVAELPKDFRRLLRPAARVRG
ncbi:DUF2267 domain-containing protein [Micromonospora thermarum]|uniref:DUF2267 domain-containing protein n=1 Tax=Micromonospora thermarum TaxID=2720024 RepID=A0ABX0ZAG1_9ACTN|nr:DUF2267 domain-containing protein [Micromonospora thermarum]NJP34886.1 DUF2267 domain-containing protein [Micromonospora thermarum]